MPNPVAMIRVVSYGSTSSVIPCGPVNKAKNDIKLSVGRAPWRTRSAEKPFRGCTSNFRVPCLPLDQDMTVKGCVWVHDHKLTVGIQRLMYWPGLTCTGRGKIIWIFTTFLMGRISPSMLLLEKNIRARGAPRPENIPLWYKSIPDSRNVVSPRMPSVT